MRSSVSCASARACVWRSPAYLDPRWPLEAILAALTIVLVGLRLQLRRLIYSGIRKG
jgi:hypothetical protein